MSMRKHIIVVPIALAALLLGTAGILPAAAQETAATPQGKPALSETSQASCVLKITCDPAVFPLTPDTVSALLDSAGVRGQAYREVFGEDEFSPVHFTVLGGGGSSRYRGSSGQTRGVGRGPAALGSAAPSDLAQHMIVGSVTVDTESVVGRGADEYLAAVCQRFQAALAQAHHGEGKLIREQLDKAEIEAHRAKQDFERLQSARRELCQEAGRTDLSREAILDYTRRFENEKLELEMETASQDARRAAVAKQIAETGDKANRPDQAAKAAIAAAEGRLEMLKDRLEQMREYTHPQESDLRQRRETEVQLLEAHAELAERRKAMTEAAGGDLIAGLNQELAGLSVEHTEVAARLKFINEQLVKSKDLLGLADQYERDVELELPLARDAYEQVRVYAAELQRRIRLPQPPMITILGGK